MPGSSAELCSVVVQDDSGKGEGQRRGRVMARSLKLGERGQQWLVCRRSTVPGRG